MNSESNNNLNPDIEQLRSALFAYNDGRVQKLRQAQTRLVHYTSAEVGYRIIQNRQIWMRNAIAMNDYSEIQYGESCLHDVWHAAGGTRLKVLLQSIYPDMVEQIQYDHNHTQKRIRSNTFITCVSEHLEPENQTGRLSMWRAYGGDNGVALIFDNSAIDAPIDRLRAYSSPVAYLTAKRFEEHLNDMASRLEANTDAIRNCGYQITLNLILVAFRFAILSTKHPGFAEEREWRIIYTPDLHTSEHIEKNFEVVAGLPQVVYKLPVEDISKIKAILIGPTKYPKTLSDTFVELLSQAGVSDAAMRVVVSDMPLRK